MKAKNVYRQTFPEEGHGLKRFFHNGRQKTTIFIGLFLMTSSNTNYSATQNNKLPLWNWASFDFESNQFTFKNILRNRVEISFERQKILFWNSLQLLLKWFTENETFY